ncbi:MAG: hypothetical protein MUE40_09190 [Anaerolineae bacterium]|jgi:hypothetical protein|nr:hypothetical protein [Anaerolineae bacterium]
MTELLQRMMQEQLDGVLADEQVSELYQRLNEDEDAAAQFARLGQVDRLMSNPPFARAPQRLAATIMARLAQTVQQQTETEDMPDEVRQALHMSVSLVILAMTPMMVAASWMVLNARYNPKLLTRVLERTIALMVMMIQALIFLLEETEQMARRHPDKAALAFSLIPVVLMGMLEYVYGTQNNGEAGVKAPEWVM